MFDSPLSKVVRDRRINSILEAIRRAYQTGQPLSIAPKDVDYIRRRFHKGIMLGEQKLHEMADRLLKTLAPGFTRKITLIVWGRCAQPMHPDIVQERYDLTKKIDELLSTPDSLLAHTHAPLCPQCRLKATVIASFIQYRPESVPEGGLRFLFTRVKSPSTVCYKIADMVCDIDFTYRRDKIYNELSQVVTDMYGIKAVAAQDRQVLPMVQAIQRRRGI